jgi:hypothetical protein
VRTALTVFALICLVGMSTAAASTRASAEPIAATFVGDSVSASISYVPSAQRKLTGGLAVRLDAKVCRRLVAPSCTFQGTTPTTALQAVRSYERTLGRVLIVAVGYNEDGRGYSDGIDRVMRAALVQGANGVVWVTLEEAGRYAAHYRTTNLAIRRAAKRWPQLFVADWNAYGDGRPWFGGDGLHLTVRGATEFAAFLRPYVFRAAEDAR